MANHPHVGNIDGLGMEVGLDLVVNKQNKKPNASLYKKTVTQALKKGLWLNGNGDGNFQIMPPLIIEQKWLDQGLAIFIDLLKKA